MADEEDNEQPVVEAPRKKSRLLGVLVTSVLIISAGVAGTVLGPRFLAYRAAAAAKAAAEQAQKAASKFEFPENSMAFHPLVVDVRDKSGIIHHIKVGLTIELDAKVKKEEFDKLQPRGRAAAIVHLRAKSFEQLTEPSLFEVVTKDLNDRIVQAMGEQNAERVIITDFVVQ